MRITTLQEVWDFLEGEHTLSNLYFIWNPDELERKKRKKYPVTGADALSIIGRQKAWAQLIQRLDEMFPESRSSISMIFEFDRVLDCSIPRKILLDRAYAILLQDYNEDILRCARKVSIEQKSQLFSSLLRKYIYTHIRLLQHNIWNPQILVEFANICNHVDTYQNIAKFFVDRVFLDELDILSLSKSNNSNLSHETIVMLRR